MLISATSFSLARAPSRPALARTALTDDRREGDPMDLLVHQSKIALGQAAADRASAAIREAIERNGLARVIAATGASQFEFLDALTSQAGIEWARVECFHLDEYVGLPDTHPASFRRYLRERIVERVHPAAFHFLAGDAADPDAECRRVGELLRAAPVDVAFVGIGENGHLAFNDPPADFDTEEPYLVVGLDDACRRQQLGEGWFPSLDAVPRRAISMSIRQILKAREILCVVPDARKARAVRECLEGAVSPLHPASALQNHASTKVYLDPDSAALLASPPRV
jgi:glucosamine-6-phosphate deaminase